MLLSTGRTFPCRLQTDIRDTAAPTRTNELLVLFGRQPRLSLLSWLSPLAIVDLVLHYLLILGPILAFLLPIHLPTFRLEHHVTHLSNATHPSAFLPVSIV